MFNAENETIQFGNPSLSEFLSNLIIQTYFGKKKILFQYINRRVSYERK